MKISRDAQVFAVLFSLSMVLGFAIHFLVLHLTDSPNSELLIGYYSMNGLLGLLMGITIIKLSVTRPEITGFSFLGGSAVKFAVFFLVFYPDLDKDEVIRKSQFITFIIPYALSMIVEVWFLIRYLNRTP